MANVKLLQRPQLVSLDLDIPNVNNYIYIIRDQSTKDMLTCVQTSMLYRRQLLTNRHACIFDRAFSIAGHRKMRFFRLTKIAECWVL